MPTAPVIKVRDVAFPRLSVPDLDAMEGFLLDFGTVCAFEAASQWGPNMLATFGRTILTQPV